jgi:glycosyltransferase involved in cell wall biosynthesis
MNPLVSIIMPAYNVAPWIAEAIQSVLNQSYQNFELIVIDNNSTDQTRSIIRSFSDKRIIAISESEQGLSAARNAGLKTMRGEYYCFLDADDVLPAGSIGNRVKILQENDSIDFVDGMVETRDHALRKTLRTWRPSFEGVLGDEMNKIIPRCYAAVSWLIRKRNPVVLFNTEWKSLEDRIFFREISKSGRYTHINEIVYVVRRRQESLMSDHSTMERAFRKFIDDQKNEHHQQRNFIKKQEKVFHSIFMKTYARNLQIRMATFHFVGWIRNSC